ncbi:MAG: hypothetical protein Q9209_000893 [Squamulea sp. 1 TL-2023]
MESHVKVQKERLKTNLATMDWESNATDQANVQGTGGEISIRGLAGPYTVVGSNFAPGTTAADIEAAMLPIGGQMQDCRIVDKVPNVVAEMVFSEKAQADNVIATFNNKKADGRLLSMHLRLGKSSPPPKAPSQDAPPRNAPSEPKAARVDLMYEENTYNQQREQSNQSRRRAEPQLQDGSYGFEAEEDRMEVDNDNRRDSYRDGPRHFGRGRDVGPPRVERPLYSDDLYRLANGDYGHKGIRNHLRSITASFNQSLWDFLMRSSIMGSTVASNGIAATQETLWDEARTVSSMAHLQELHARLTHLRDAVSRLVDPMLVQQTSPEELYTNFATNVTKTQTEVQDFTKLFKNDKSNETFQRAAESRSQNKDGIRGWRVTEHEDWLDVGKVDAPKDGRGEGPIGSNLDVPHSINIEDLRTAMERFKKNHPDLRGSFDETSWNMTSYKTKSPPS